MPERDFLETVATENARLRVRFHCQADRFAHGIDWVHGESVHPLLDSVEGTADDRWPPSPVLQHVHWEERKVSAVEGDSNTGKTVALLVGMGGRSHWSMSVEPAATGMALEFDVACRVAGGECPHLQSTYRAAHGSGSIQTGRWSLGLFGGWQLAVIASDAFARVDCNDSVLKISPGDSSPPTWRWKYRVELARG